jgi:hypothetical protein
VFTSKFWTELFKLSRVKLQPAADVDFSSTIRWTIGSGE